MFVIRLCLPSGDGIRRRTLARQSKGRISFIGKTHLRQVRAQNDGHIVHEQKQKDTSLLQVRGNDERRLRQADYTQAVY